MASSAFLAALDGSAVAATPSESSRFQRALEGKTVNVKRTQAARRQGTKQSISTAAIALAKAVREARTTTGEDHVTTDLPDQDVNHYVRIRPGTSDLAKEAKSYLPTTKADGGGTAIKVTSAMAAEVIARALRDLRSEHGVSDIVAVSVR